MIPADDMRHLPGFWDAANWSDEAWSEYRRRRREHGLKNRIEQLLHRAMGRLLSLDAWRRREAAQWPSTSGSFDPCEDHWNYLVGAGRREAAANLRAAARKRRPEFLA